MFAARQSVGEGAFQLTVATSQKQTDGNARRPAFRARYTATALVMDFQLSWLLPSFNLLSPFPLREVISFVPHLTLACGTHAPSAWRRHRTSPLATLLPTCQSLPPRGSINRSRDSNKSSISRFISRKHRHPPWSSFVARLWRLAVARSSSV